jgi:hypothetical protein
MNGSSPRPALEQALRGAISKHAERGALDVADVGLAVGQLLLVVITEALTRAAYGGRALTASLAPHGQDQGLELGAGLAGRPVGAVLGAGLAGGVVRGVALGAGLAGGVVRGVALGAGGVVLGVALGARPGRGSRAGRGAGGTGPGQAVDFELAAGLAAGAGLGAWPAVGRVEGLAGADAAQLAVAGWLGVPLPGPEAVTPVPTGDSWVP